MTSRLVTMVLSDLWSGVSKGMRGWGLTCSRPLAVIGAPLLGDAVPALAQARLLLEFRVWVRIPVKVRVRVSVRVSVRVTVEG